MIYKRARVVQSEAFWLKEGEPKTNEIIIEWEEVDDDE